MFDKRKNELKEQNVCWEQLLSNFRIAFSQLLSAFELNQVRPLSDLEQLGLFHEFEVTYDLAVGLLKSYLEYQGYCNFSSSSDVIRQAFSVNLISAGKHWMKMVENRESFTYDKVYDSVGKITKMYIKLFHGLLTRMTKLSEG